MHIPPPAVMSLLKKDSASAVPPSWLPKFVRHALINLQTQFRAFRRNASRWVLLAVLILAVASVVLVCNVVSRATSNAFPSKRTVQNAALSAEKFRAIVRNLEDNKNTPRTQLSDPTIIRQGKEHWSQPRDDALLDGDWDSIADDVAIAIKTGHEVAAARLQTLRKSGWLSVGHRVPNLLVVSDADDTSLGAVGVMRYAIDVVAGRFSNASRARAPRHWFEREGWRGDKDKNLPILHMLATTFPGKKWYMLLDDDTYVFLENFARYTHKHAKGNKAVYTGKVFYISNCGGFGKNGTPKNSSQLDHGLFVHGGAGIFMNNKAMDAIFPLIPDCIAEFSSCWAGDMQVGLCMHKAGVHVHNFIRGHSHEYMFTPFWPSRAMADSRYTKRLQSLAEPVSFHKIPETELKLISKFERHCAIQGNRVTYNGLRRYLQENEIEPMFGKKKTKWDTNVFFDKR